jgi:hypothetical protein
MMMVTVMSMDGRREFFQEQNVPARMLHRSCGSYKLIT